MNIYVASSWRNNTQPETVKILRAAGHEVYDFKNPVENEHGFSWSQIDPDWKNWTPERWRNALSTPIAEHGFKRDFTAMKWADVCVLVLKCGASAHTEAGWMAGAGKISVALVLPENGPHEPELMYKLFDNICTSHEELVKYLSDLETSLKNRCSHEGIGKPGCVICDPRTRMGGI